MHYIPLHGHSTFSFLEAIGTIKKIANKAKKMTLPAIAITDYNGMYGSIQLYNLAKEYGFKPIVGTELGFVLDIQTDYPIESIGNICLLAYDKEGYHNLLQLISYANTIGITKKPKIDLGILTNHSRGLIAFMGGEQSRIGKMIINNEHESKIVEIINQIQTIVGPENTYLEITAQDPKSYPSLQHINDTLIHIASLLSLECIVNNNYFYINKKDKKAWEAALAIKDNVKLYDPTRRKPAGKHHIMTAEEIVDICTMFGYTREQIDTWLATNMSIADRITTQIDLGKTYFPNYSVAIEIAEMYAKYKDILVE